MFFGCRNREQDYIYKEELEAYERCGAIDKLFVAFSREGSQKDYVQHHIEREPKLVAPLLREGPETQGILYICGDAKNMAKVSITFRSLGLCVALFLPGCAMSGSHCDDSGTALRFCLGYDATPLGEGRVCSSGMKDVSRCRMWLGRR